MGKFTRAEMERAFAHYVDVAGKSIEAWDWRGWANLFTEDAEYVEHSFGTFRGREAIYNWVTKTMAPPAGKVWGSFPVRWHFVDEEKGWILCCFINRMADLGDGIVREVDNWSLLKYAGDDLWSYEEDIYNMAEFREAITQWHEIKAASESTG
jgi:SnoaL-like domain